MCSIMDKTVLKFKGIAYSGRLSINKRADFFLICKIFVLFLGRAKVSVAESLRNAADSLYFFIRKFYA